MVYERFEVMPQFMGQLLVLKRTELSIFEVYNSLSEFVSIHSQFTLALRRDRDLSRAMACVNLFALTNKKQRYKSIYRVFYRAISRQKLKFKPACGR